MAKATTSLQSMEDRLRRAFRLAGTIGTSFEPAAIPVVIAADARDPGNNFVQGRRWWGAYAVTNAAAGGSSGFKFGADGILDGFIWSGQNAAINIVATLLVDQSVADPYAMNTLGAAWAEIRNTQADRAPVASAVGQAIAAPAASPNLVQWLTTANTPFVWQYPVQVRAGDRLFFANNAATGSSFLTLFGRF